MQNAEVVIIGGGIAGLYAASQLQERGITYQLFETKPLFGGRVAGIPVTLTSGTESESGENVENSEILQLARAEFYDVGPAWIFAHHLRMQALVLKMGLSLFEQHASGDVLYQFENTKAPRQIPAPAAQTLHRVKGGSYGLIRSLVKSLDVDTLHTKHKVIDVSKQSSRWRATAVSNRQKQQINCQHVLFALPPRVIARDFSNATFMSSALKRELSYSQTWMAAQAKIIVTYTSPFWREKGLSGQAFSQVGPIVEIHDACCSPSHGFALFGFIGIPAAQRQQMSQKALKQACIKQLADIYGHQAYRFQKCYLKDWAKDTDICTGQDQSEGSRHPQINNQICEEALINENIYLAGSEFATADAGYLEGALIAVDTALQKLTSRL